MALEEANSDKSKVYTEKLGEAEQFKQNICELEKIPRMKNEEVNGRPGSSVSYSIFMKRNLIIWIKVPMVFV